MSEILTLYLLELRSLYGINKFLASKDKKLKKRYRMLACAWAVLMCMLIFYISSFVLGLCVLGLSSAVPAYLSVIASFLILMFGIFTAGKRIFGQNGYDILASMPIRSESIVAGRFLSMYTEDLILTLAVMIPGCVTYGICVRPEISFYFIFAVCVIFIPAIPIVISVLIGTFVLIISSRIKRKSLVESFLTVVFVVGILLLSFSTGSAAEGFTEEAIRELADNIGSMLYRLYPPAMLIDKAATDGSIISLILFILISVLFIGGAVFIASKLFHSVIRRLGSFTAKHDYKIGKLGTRGLLRALYEREAKRYFASSIYVTNTIIGPIMGAIMSVALCAFGLDNIKSQLPLEFDITVILPFVFSAVFCMMTPAAVSISMEGKYVWAIKSLPIPQKMLYDSKILFALSLMLPFFAVSYIALAIAVGGDTGELIWLFIIPVSFMIFSNVFGVAVNLKFHSFDWERDETVVKQSLPAALGGFAPFIVSILFGGAIMAVPPEFTDISRLILTLVLLSLSAWLYRGSSQKKLEDL